MILLDHIKDQEQRQRNPNLDLVNGTEVEDEVAPLAPRQSTDTQRRRHTFYVWLMGRRFAFLSRR